MKPLNLACMFLFIKSKFRNMFTNKGHRIRCVHPQGAVNICTELRHWQKNSNSKAETLSDFHPDLCFSEPLLLFSSPTINLLSLLFTASTIHQSPHVPVCAYYFILSVFMY